MPTATGLKRLCVFDFDYTLIEADSDYWVVENLKGARAGELEQLHGKVQWTDLQEKMLGKLFEQGVLKEDFERVLRRIPLTPEIATALRLMKSQGAELCIISDANHFYINTVLETNGLKDLFTTIITNPSHFDDRGCLHVARHHGPDLEPHGCPHPCGLNLCKGQEIQKMIDSNNWDQIVYMGDSTNDFCPSTRLQSKDIVLARSDLLLEKEIKAQPDLIKAKVVYWESPAAALTAIQEIFKIPASKSTQSSSTSTSSITIQAAA